MDIGVVEKAGDIVAGLNQALDRGGATGSAAKVKQNIHTNGARTEQMTVERVGPMDVVLVCEYSIPIQCSDS